MTRTDLDAAEQRHRVAKTQRNAAIDPLTKRDEERRKAAEEAAQVKAERVDRTFTVRRLAQDYVTEISGRKRSWKEDQRIFDKYVIPYLGDKPVGQVGVKDVRRVLKYLEQTPIMRDRTLACARSAWNWHDAVGLNPWTAEKIPVRPPRDRVLSVVELRDLLKRLDKEAGGGRDIVALILLTGVRREEAAGARREEFDGDNWRIPKSRMKGGIAHTVLLSTQVKELLGRVLASHNSEWLFPSPRTSGPLDRGHGYKWLKSAGVTYHLHDLRRSMSTWLGEQLVHDAVIDRMLAHRRTGINRHYIHAKLFTPAQEAWQSWSDYLDGFCDEKVELIGTQA